MDWGGWFEKVGVLVDWTKRVLGAWLLASLVVVFPVLLVLWPGPEVLRAWIPAYVAGAFGGLVHELIASRWQVELPSVPEQTGPDEKNEFAKPLGPRVDLGFFGRMFTGGLAAFTVLLLARYLASAGGSAYLPTAAETPATIAWAVAIGFTSPAAWKAIKKLADARYATLTAQAEAKDEQRKREHRALRQTRDKLRGGRQGQRNVVVREPAQEELGSPAPTLDEAAGALDALLAMDDSEG